MQRARTFFSGAGQQPPAGAHRRAAHAQPGAGRARRAAGGQCRAAGHDRAGLCRGHGERCAPAFWHGRAAHRSRRTVFGALAAGHFRRPADSVRPAGAPAAASGGGGATAAARAFWPWTRRSRNASARGWNSSSAKAAPGPCATAAAFSGGKRRKRLFANNFHAYLCSFLPLCAILPCGRSL